MNSLFDKIDKDRQVFVINMAKVTTQCDNCKQNIDTSKPKPTKDKTGKAVKPKPNPGIEATLEYPIDSGETKSYHFCDERCLYEFLKTRFTKK